jgi:hypothetical protein
MQSIRSSARHLAARLMATRLAPALIGVMVLLTGITQLYAQNRTATASLVLQVRSEEVLQEQNGVVALKIRLARGTTARLWATNFCTSPPPESQVITQSGYYSIPLSGLRPMISEPNSGASLVCLQSSDGMLSDSLPVVIIAPGDNTGGQGPPRLMAAGVVSVNVPAGWAVTARPGTKTWSNP